MKIFNDLETAVIRENTALTIGKFDGLHRGHRELAERVVSEKENGLSPLLIRLKNAGDRTGRELLTDEELVAFLESLGIEYFIDLPMTRELMGTEPDVFLNDILLKRFKMKVMACGSDFCFGKNRKGDTAFLQKYAENGNFAVDVFDKLRIGDTEISSTYIRGCLKEGRTEEANDALGYRYSMTGEIVGGLKLARALGYPTANMIPDPVKILPAFGVYAVTVEIAGMTKKGMANIGVKPTITAENRPLLEVHILDFSGDIYGQTMKVYFDRFVRPEMKFSSVSELKAQMTDDIENSRR